MSPAATTASSRILMLTSWSEQSHPAELGQAEVAALSDHAAAQLGAVHPNRVIGAVADVGGGLARALDVGADPAVPQQVDRRLQNRSNELVGSHRGRLDPEHGADLRRELHGLGAAGDDAAPG